MRSFARMEKYTSTVAWLVVAGYIGQLLALVLVGHLLLSLPFSSLTGAAMALVALLIGTRLRGLNNIVHECSHATFANDRALNTTIGSICSSMTLGCFADYRYEHLTHHAHLGDYDHDLDLQGIKDLRLHEPLTRKVLLRHLTNPLLGRHLPYYLHMNMSSRDGKAFKAMKIGLILAAIAITLAAPLTGILFVLVPFVLVYSTLNYWADCMDHAGIVASEDELDASRNILAPWPVRVLFFPRNDCFHLVHHLFPHIPARHLEMSHEQLTQDEIYAAKANALRKPRRRPVEASDPAAI